MVGGSGILVNLLVTVLLNKIVPHYQGVAIDLPFTSFNIRWYHIIAVAAFMVANTWNYELNRRWTFKARGRGVAHWWLGLLNFMGIGLAALVVGLIMQTAMLKPESAFYLGHIHWLDDSNGFRTKLYWASLIQIAFTMPINFIVNKLWTFRAVRRHKPGQELPLLAPVVDPQDVDDTGEIRVAELREQLNREDSARG